MSLFIASLNSGSNGNCYYVGNEHEAVLIDAGISCRETERRMLRLGLSMQKVKAIFVSHEHSDHINGIPVIAKKYRLPVYITPPTLQRGGLMLDQELVISFAAFDTIIIGDLHVTAFPKQHDASNPHSFLITCRDVKVGVFTDIGIVCENLVNHFSQCHAAFLEANYDDEMLDKGGYPYHLKRRIRGGQGHLSNKQALELFTTHKPAFMTHLLLSHLSKNNNDPQLVQNLFDDCADGVNIIVASRYIETEVYYISNMANDVPVSKPRRVEVTVQQISLF
ncbi:MAG: MBL fold metallo-hydrolase [Bacteroidota bacterium]|nr:MBL fold metallo-hydrolase [Bacteroidota bacterium]